MPYSVQHPVLLVVDDDERLRELVHFAALESGVFSSVQLAADGSEVLARLHVAGNTDAAIALPDMILTDLSMPEVNGLELTAQLKSDPRTRDIPIVMFSSSNVPYDRERALAAGCIAFYEKPVGLAALKEMLHSIGSLLKTA